MKTTRFFMVETLTLFLIFTTIGFAESSYIGYQGVAYNSGSAVANGTVSLRFTIYEIDGTTVVYQETKSGVATTDKGFFSHQIGSGTRTAGAANWAGVVLADDYKLKTEMDIANGTTYTDLGTDDFSSVMYSKKSESANTATALAANPTDCVGGTFATEIDANGNLTCTSPSYITDTKNTINNTLTSTSTTESLSAAQGKALNDLKLNLSGGTISGDLTVSGTITGSITGNSATATALVANPNDCVVGTFATDIDAGGNLVCGTPNYTTDTKNTINNTLTSTSTTESLSAAQGKVLKDALDGKLSSSGNAVTATALAANGANCPAGEYPLGVDASGAVESCTSIADATGTGTTASGTDSFATGENTTSLGAASMAGGTGTSAIGNYSFAMGEGSTATGPYSVAIGLRAHTENWYSFAMGRDTNASDHGAVAMGYQSHASADQTFAMGVRVTAGGDQSVAMGMDTTTSGPYSFAMGQEANASNHRAFATGYSTIASGSTSVAMGYDTNATGDYSFSSGVHTLASGDRSVAMGDGTQSSGYRSFAHGFQTVASTNQAVAFGEGTTADQTNMMTVGQYNTVGNTSALFVVGNGTSGSPSDAFVVKSDGKVGIGTTTPVAQLHVVGSGSGVGYDEAGQSYFMHTYSSLVKNTTTTSNDAGIYATNNILTDKFFIAVSDERIKEDIKPIENSIQTIKKLKPSSYRKIDKIKNGNQKHYGFIAQELEKVIPEAIMVGKGEVPVLKPFEEVDLEDDAEYVILVKNGSDIKEMVYKTGDERPDGEIIVKSKKVDDFRTVAYDTVFTVAVDAIQEQQEIIETQQSTIENQENEIKDLKERLEAIEKALKNAGIK